MIVLNSILIIVLVAFSVKDTKEIRSLRKMSESKDKYIQLLERRAREERIRKNNQFNNK
tara:strand:+ start:575 stop:751 length:177 start_codon:yes stop_codon:yes gene_type:complete